MILTFVVLLLPFLSSAEDKPEIKHRPKVGLVLGGGGALGIAHIGVLRKLEEMRIPVDYIAGTSMGSIMAGFYASGLSPDEMEDFVNNMDWWDVLKDQTPYRDLDFRRKEESIRYLMDIELGIQNFRFLFPYGLGAGQKFNNLLQSMVINSAGATTFDELNIPYRAVATDLRSGQAVILDRGNLAVAMRASMAVPGAFTPVLIDGKLLVDGGLVNNIPVDIVKAMGADVIIAVDVGSCETRAAQKGDFNSLGKILGRTYSIMQRPKDDARRQAADILIEPDMNGLTAGDFHRSRELIPCGAAVAEANSNKLSRLSVSPEEYSLWLSKQRAKTFKDMTIKSVEIVGNKSVPLELIKKRIETKPGDKVDFGNLRNDVARIHGMGDFQSVTHRLVPSGNPGEYDLKIDTVEKYWGPNYMHLGLRLESNMDGDSSYSMLMNFRQANLNRLGGETRLDLEFGKNQNAFGEWYQPLQKRGFFFVAPALEVGNQRQNIYQDGDKVAEYQRDIYGAHFDAGTQFKQYGEFRVGLVSGKMKAEPATGDPDLPDVDPGLGAYTMKLTVDRLDARVFARKGYYLSVNGYFSEETFGADDEYKKLQARIRYFASLGDHTADVGFRAGHALGSDIPAYDQFLIGGMGMIPGLAPEELRGQYYDIVNLNYRYRLGRLSPSLGKGIYAVAGVSAGNAWQNSDEIDAGDLIVGGMAGFALDTIAGPVAFAVGRAEEGTTQYYLSLGTLF